MTKIGKVKIKIPHRTFRPWPANQSALQHADKAGFNISEVLNELVSIHLATHLDEKTDAMKQATRALKALKARRKTNGFHKLATR